jgi:hypothetical protein
MTPAELERSVENLRGIVAKLLADLERLKTHQAQVRAGLSHHQHDFTRDIQGRPSTYPAETHTHAAYSLSDHTHTGYADASHTHTGYSSSTHVHNYNDYQPKDLQYNDISRTTGGPV